MMHIKNKTVYWLIIAAIALFTGVSAYFLMTRSDAGIIIQAPATHYMLIEMAILAAWFFIVMYFVTNQTLGYCIMAVVAYLFLWAHQIAIPAFVSGAYVAALILVGEAFISVISSEGHRKITQRLLHDFLTGSMIYISVFCILNLFGIGGVVIGRIVIIALLVISVIYIALFKYTKKRVSIPFEEIPSEKELKDEKKSRLWICLAIAVTFSMALMQAARINITLDYDSLHYGLRSPYILDQGKGIYEYLGFVNDVYVYPKGLEVLALPLNGTTTYGGVLSFSWWMSCGVLYAIYLLVRKMNTRKSGVYAAMVASTIPGIMNMGCSAKTDIATVLIQLIAIYDLLDEEYMWAGVALLFSLALKPTSLVFSGAIFIVAIIYVLISKKKISFNEWPVIIPAVLATGLIIARSIYLTGFPSTSAAAGVWKALGFVKKYPFGGVTCFSSVNALNTLDTIERYIGIFACPVGHDMSHVYIAWGGTGIAIMLFFGFLGNKNKLIKTIALVILAISIVFIAILYQVDGNYFMLLYVLSVVLFFGGQYSVHFMLPVLILNIIMCVCTNWCGSFGLTPISFNHQGYYDHREFNYSKLASQGSGEIYEYLARDRKQKVMAMAYPCDCYLFPCNVQSYTDLDGGGGNTALVRTDDDFKEFIDFSGTQYFYTTDEFLVDHPRSQELINAMLADESIELLIDKGTSKLYIIK